MSIRPLLLPALIAATLIPAVALAQQSSSASTAADRFSLDLPVDDTVTAPADEPAPVATPAPEPAPEPAPSAATFSLDTPIATLIADPGARAVLDHHLPGLSTDANLAKFQALSLRKLAPLTGGQMTGDLLTRTAHDLAALTAGTLPPGRAKTPSRSLPSGR